MTNNKKQILRYGLFKASKKKDEAFAYLHKCLSAYYKNPDQAFNEMCRLGVIGNNDQLYMQVTHNSDHFGPLVDRPSATPIEIKDSLFDFHNAVLEAFQAQSTLEAHDQQAIDRLTEQQLEQGD